MLVKTSETGCSLVALFFLDFPGLRNDSFLDNIAPWHISVLKSLFLKAAVVSPVVSFTLQWNKHWRHGCATVSWPVSRLSISQFRNTG